MTKPKRKTGTREWAAHNLNIAKGCSHDCRYCYARHDAVRRFKTVEPDDWTKMQVMKDRVTKGYGKRKNNDSAVYDIMFPTAHDITPEIIDDCMEVLEKVLRAGNTVLVVTKPHEACIRAIVAYFKAWRDKMAFRFTIGADTDAILSVWEPGAPAFAERLWCLKHAFDEGYRTSVSAEPMLDPENIDRLVNRLLPFINETLWIGKMNKVRARCEGVPEETLAALEAAYASDKILAIVDRWDGKPKIKWKDSIKLVIESRP